MRPAGRGVNAFAQKHPDNLDNPVKPLLPHQIGTKMPQSKPQAQRQIILKNDYYFAAGAGAG